MTPNAVDGQWLDFYALLDVPVNADEDTIRKRIGKVYAEAAANSDHRDLTKRHYFQALVERVLPQCRRVLLDPEWRAKYDRQHILHSIGDPSAQDYVTFIASVRGGVVKVEEAKIPARVQEEIKLAQQVVETVQTGEQMDLIPAKAISVKQEMKEPEPVPEPAPERLPTKRAVEDAPAPKVEPRATPVAESGTYTQAFAQPAKEAQPAAPAVRHTIDAAQLEAELSVPEDTVVRAKVITAQEAADIRRRRASNVDGREPIMPASLHKNDDGNGVVVPTKHKKSGVVSRVTVGDSGVRRNGAKKPKLISSTSLNLMVAITGVLLTITIQKMALLQPAVAGNSARGAVYVAASSSLEPALEQAATSWEQTADGQGYNIVLQSTDSESGLRRALGSGDEVPDAWIPSDSMWRNRYNDLANQRKRRFISSGSSLVTTPLVLIARADHAATLKQYFPNHLVPSWDALRTVVVAASNGRFGMTDPVQSGAGAIARYAMADEWSRGHGMSLNAALRNPQFWTWMKGFEDNSPARPELSSAMVKDLVLGTTGNYWWALAYESDALGWMNKGKSLEIFYLPRTIYADHPFCELERIGAANDTPQARSSFERFLRSDGSQKALLKAGFRPTEIEITTKVDGNPFLNADFRKHGARYADMPRPQRVDYEAVDAVVSAWAKRNH